MCMQYKAWFFHTEIRSELIVSHRSFGQQSEIYHRTRLAGQHKATNYCSAHNFVRVFDLYFTFSATCPLLFLFFPFALTVLAIVCIGCVNGTSWLSTIYNFFSMFSPPHMGGLPFIISVWFCSSIIWIGIVHLILWFFSTVLYFFFLPQAQILANKCQAAARVYKYTHLHLAQWNKRN